MLRFFNTLSRKVEVFKPLQNKEVKMYSCGPTVYDYAHLGNLRAYVFSDLLKRYLQYKGFSVKHIMNITDVDDKTIRESQKQKKSLKQFTDFFRRAFLRDLKFLNIELPTIMPLATKHIKEMTALIKTLFQKGFAYRAEDGSVYFKIAACFSYGELAQLSRQNLQLNADSRLRQEDEYEKENANDFVLWKSWRPEDGPVFWETEFGKGRPGWHIECSAMSIKYLGCSFDIHTGGSDLVFPHHTNEIAQSEAATGKKFVNYWLHNAHLLIEGKKMSKSLGNFYTLLDFQKKKINPLIVRLVLLKTHYRQTMDFSLDNLEESKFLVWKFLNFLMELEKIKNNSGGFAKTDFLVKQCRQNWETALDNDLDIGAALTVLFDFIGKVNQQTEKLNVQDAKKIKKFIFEIDTVLGFIRPLFQQYQQQKNAILRRPGVRSLLNKRMKLRKERQFAAADRVRKQLLQQGIVVDDLGDNYFVRLKNRN